MAKAIGTLGTIDTLTVGGRIFTDLTTLIITGGMAAATNYTSLRKPGGSGGYQVTAGKTLTIYGFRYSATAAAGSTQIITTLSYVDTDAGINQATNGSNPVYMYGSSTQSGFGDNASFARDKNMFEYNPHFPVIAAKYHSVQGGVSNTLFQAFSYEA